MRLLRALVILSLLAMSVRPCSACSCVVLGDARDSVRYTEAVFRGIVITVQDVGVPQAGAVAHDGYPLLARRLVIFQTLETWRGRVQERHVVFTGGGGGDCGFPFEEGREYLVFADSGEPELPGTLTTSICTHTELATEETRRSLGRPRTPSKIRK